VWAGEGEFFVDGVGSIFQGGGEGRVASVARLLIVIEDRVIVSQVMTSTCIISSI
jgi:hypothetical protein